MSSVNDLVVIVTGGAGAEGGLGLTFTESLARAGAKVVVWDPDATACAAAEKELHTQGLDVTFAPVDVTDVVAVRDAHEQVIERFGRVDGLINNAARKMAGMRGPETPASGWSREFWTLDPQRALAILQINVIGPLNTSTAVAPGMIAQGSGSIINITTSPHTRISAKHIPYGPSKAALEAMSVAMSSHLAGTGVRVNCLYPGRSANRRGEYDPQSAPSDCMVDAALWLLSNEAAVTSGQSISGEEFTSQTYGRA